jgi:hypothetical protein
MRPAELVVKYLTGDRLPSENTEWGGIFMCSEEQEVEQAFAAAEPPAHDDWDPRSLPDGDTKKTYVRVAMRRIKQCIAEVTGTLSVTPDDDGERASLGLVADSLGALLGAGEGQRLGSRQSKRKKTKKKSAKKVTLSRPRFIKHKEVDNQTCAVFEITAQSTELIELRIDGEAKIAKDGGGADKTDSRGQSARVLSWRTKNSGAADAASIEMTLDGKEKLTATVAIPEGKAVSFNASYEETR